MHLEELSKIAAPYIEGARMRVDDLRAGARSVRDDILGLPTSARRFWNELTSPTESIDPLQAAKDQFMATRAKWIEGAYPNSVTIIKPGVTTTLTVFPLDKGGEMWQQETEFLDTTVTSKVILEKPLDLTSDSQMEIATIEGGHLGKHKIGEIGCLMSMISTIDGLFQEKEAQIQAEREALASFDPQI